MMTLENIFQKLKISPIEEGNLKKLLTSGADLDKIYRGIYSKAMAIYFNFPGEFSSIKKNLFLSFDSSDDWSFSFNCLNCCFVNDLNIAKIFFSKNLDKIDSDWLALILSSAIGRDVTFSLNCYKDFVNHLSENQINIFKKYFVTQKVGLTFNDINIQNFDSENRYEIKKSEVKESRSLKIAICVSGQLRGFETAKLSWDKIFYGHSVDYYVHTWSSNGVVQKKEPSFNRIYPNQLKNFLIDLSGINHNLSNNIYRHLLPENLIDEDQLKLVYGDNCKYFIENSIESFSNSEKMYYKIFKCFQLIENPSKYDLVIRLRPDLVLEKIGDISFCDFFEESKKRFIFTEYGYTLAYYGFGIDDKIAIGSPEMMKVYSDMWLEKEKYMPLQGHSSLADYLFERGINVSSINKFFKTFICDNSSVDRNFLRKLISFDF